MKINLGLLLGCLIFSIGWSQNYTPLLDQRNEWQVTYCYFGCNTDFYYTDGDTIVDDKSYKILDGYHYISRTLLIREDVDQQKVYIKRLPSEERLIYDFKLEEGDSMEMYNVLSPFPDHAGYFKVDSIRHLPLVDGELYKHFFLSPSPSNTISTNTATWVEGIGSLSLINSPTGEADINIFGKLSCAFKNNMLFYENLDSIKSCESRLKIKEPIIHNWPKLVYDKLSKTYQLKRMTNLSTLATYDGLGRKYSIPIKMDFEKITIETSNLPKGIYYLQTILTDQRRKTYKILIK